MKPNCLWILAALVAGAASAAQPDSAAQATAYPSRPIRFVVPFAAGGPSDTMARTFGQKLNQAWGQPVVVDNRTGAAGIIGADIVAKSVPDGYTLLMAQVGDTISMSLYSKLPYNFEKDFAPISLVGQTTFILVVHPSLPVRSLKELIELAKAKPGALTFGSSGAGVASHLCGELFKNAAGIDIVHVPYKGQAPATADLLGGQISFMFNNPITSLAHIKAGRLRALAVSTAKRFGELPDVPTMAESGLPDFDVGFWFGALAPAGTPKPIVRKLNAEIVKAARAPDVLERLSALGVEAIGTRPEDFARTIHAEVERWAKVVKAAGIKLD
ncbi:MAG TPA: tripartite tricarboxylate transporter substrate binding protein [Burkholderiales bacterium]|nr:tripartite tricarboxylate transporter substrate binding protein [Burkholderiales bacterium]